MAAKVVDILQVPAFLARQTDLLVACGQHRPGGEHEEGPVHGPGGDGQRRRKVPRRAGGSTQVLLTERGTFFGYNRLVNDFTGLPQMKAFGCPVVFDITHSTQQPAGMGNQSGGNPQYSPDARPRRRGRRRGRAVPRMPPRPAERQERRRDHAGSGDGRNAADPVQADRGPAQNVEGLSSLRLDVRATLFRQLRKEWLSKLI